jgi:hypothetical protein
MQVKAVTLNGAPVPDPQNVTVMNVGDVVGLELWAISNFGGAAVDQIERVRGTIDNVSVGTGGLRGDLGTNAEFNGVVSGYKGQIGTGMGGTTADGGTTWEPKELDVGGKDYGFLPLTGSPLTGSGFFYAALATGAWSSHNTGTELLARFTYTVTAHGANGDKSTVTFLGRQSATALNNGQYHLDGAATTTGVSVANWDAPIGVTITAGEVPEPSTIAMVLAGFGVIVAPRLLRRKKS